MRKGRPIPLQALFVILILLPIVPILAEEAGESKEALALKNRATAPSESAMNAAVSVDGLLSNGTATAFSEKQGARLDGYVIQVEREDDGDVHLVLSVMPHETDTNKWVVVEVTPAW